MNKIKFCSCSQIPMLVTCIPPLKVFTNWDCRLQQVSPPATSLTINFAASIHKSWWNLHHLDPLVKEIVMRPELNVKHIHNWCSSFSLTTSKTSLAHEVQRNRGRRRTHKRKKRNIRHGTLPNGKWIHIFAMRKAFHLLKIYALLIPSDSGFAYFTFSNFSFLLHFSSRMCFYLRRENFIIKTFSIKNSCIYDITFFCSIPVASFHLLLVFAAALSLHHFRNVKHFSEKDKT